MPRNGFREKADNLKLADGSASLTMVVTERSERNEKNHRKRKETIMSEKKLLELIDINKTYDNGDIGVPVLFDINLEVEEGEYVVIMGPSGSGKSTLMNIIGLLDVATEGHYILDGDDVSDKSENDMAQIRNKTIGFVFQNFNLLPRETAAENVALPLLYAGVGREERLERAVAALERMGLKERADFLPTQLSGGQKQRVAIARAIVTNPKILLADEPTGALDTKSGKQIMELFKELNDEGITIIMITHEPDIAEYGKRKLMIRDGKLSVMTGNRLEDESQE